MGIDELKRKIYLAEDKISGLNTENRKLEERIEIMLEGIKRKEKQAIYMSQCVTGLKNKAMGIRSVARGGAVQTFLGNYELICSDICNRQLENEYEKIRYSIRNDINKLKNKVYQNICEIKKLESDIDRWNYDIVKAKTEEMVCGGSRQRFSNMR